MAESAALRFCDAGDEEQRQQELQTVAAAVKAGTLALQALVQQLGAVLTGQDDRRRAAGTGLLAAVLDAVPAATSSPESCTHLVAFFCDRLKDVACLEEVLTGLLALLRGHSVATDGGVLMAHAIFAELAVQALPQRVRKLVYLIFAELLSARRVGGAQSIADDFVAGVVAAMDGEKDPRNLLVTFELVPTMVAALEPARGEMAEELFDVISCYYPITFEAPPGDKFGVTGDALRSALSAAFCATPAFSPFCLALLTDKLQTSVGTTKAMCLRDLERCAQAYGAAALDDHFARLWPQLMEESGNIDGKVSGRAAQTAGSILQVLAAAEHAAPESLLDGGRQWHPHAKAAVEAVVGRAAYTVKTQACSVHQVNCLSALTSAIAGASAELLPDVAELLTPELLQNCDPTRPQQQLAVVSLLAELACAARDASVAQPFVVHKGALLRLLATAMESDATEGTPPNAVRCLGALVGISEDEAALAAGGQPPRLLAAEEVTGVISRFGQVVLKAAEGTEGLSPLGQACVDALIAISAGHAQAVQSHALVAMHDTLQGQVAPGSAAGPEQVSAVLGALVALAQAHPSHFAFTLPRFVAELQGLVARCCGGDGAPGSAAAAPVACRVLGAMADAFGDSVADELSGAAAQHADDTHACIAGFVQLAAAPEGGEQVVDAAEAALRRVVQVMPPGGQGAVAAAAVGKLLEGLSAGSCSTQFGRTSLLRATAAVVTALSGAVAVPQCPELLALLQNVVAWNPAASRVDARVAGQCLGSIFNKDTSGSLAQAQREVVDHLTAGCRGLSALSCVRVVAASMTECVV